MRHAFFRMALAVGLVWSIAARAELAELPAEVLSVHTQAVVTLRIDAFDLERMDALAEDSRIVRGLLRARPFIEAFRPVLQEAGFETLVLVYQPDAAEGFAKVVLLSPPGPEIDLEVFRRGVNALRPGALPGPVVTSRLGGWVRFLEDPLPEPLRGIDTFRWRRALDTHDEGAAIAVTSVRPARGRLPMDVLLRRFGRENGVVAALAAGLGTAGSVQGSIDWREERVEAVARFEMNNAAEATAWITEYGAAFRRALGDLRVAAAAARGQPAITDAVTQATATASILAFAQPTAEGARIEVRFDPKRAAIYLQIMAGAYVHAVAGGDVTSLQRRNAVGVLAEAVAYHRQRTGGWPGDLDELWPWFEPLSDEVRLDPATGRPGWLTWRPLGDTPGGPLLIVAGDDPSDPRKPYLDARGVMRQNVGTAE